MAERYAHSIYRLRHKLKPEYRIKRVKYYKARGSAYYIRHDMHDGHALGVPVYAYARYERRSAGAYVLTHYYRYGHSVCYAARQGKRLQYTHGSGGALYYSGDDCARQNAKQRILKRGKYPCKLRHVSKR